MENELRHQKDNLVMTGTGLILFGLWGIVRIFMTLTLDYSYFAQSIDKLLGRPSEDDLPRETLLLVTEIIVILLMIVMISIDMFLRLKVGQYAISVGKGRRKDISGVYIFLAFILLISYSVNMSSSFLSIRSIMQSKEGDLADRIVSLIVDISNLVIIVELIISAIKVRQLSRKGREI